MSGLPLTLLPAPGAALGRLLPPTVEGPMPEPAVTVRCAAVRGPAIPFCPAVNVEWRRPGPLIGDELGGGAPDACLMVVAGGSGSGLEPS